VSSIGTAVANQQSHNSALVRSLVDKGADLWEQRLIDLRFWAATRFLKAGVGPSR
jgi:hypothetical protein